MKMLVGESFTEASDKATQEVINPANGQVVDLSLIHIPEPTRP